MEFKRVGQNTVRCKVSEQELTDMGYTLDQILKNGQETQEFMSRVFKMAESNLEMTFDNGIRTVRADFLPDHSLCLTFSSHPAEGILEHLKDIMGGLMGGEIPEELRKLAEQERDEEDEDLVPKKKNPEPGSRKPKALRTGSSISAVLAFANMDVLLRFAQNAMQPVVPYTALYQREGVYYLVMELTECTEDEVMKLSLLADEYASEIRAGQEYRAFMEEHGKAILCEKAIESLAMLS